MMMDRGSHLMEVVVRLLQNGGSAWWCSGRGGDNVTEEGEEVGRQPLLGGAASLE